MKIPADIPIYKIRKSKRVMDLCISIFVLLCASPFIILVLLALIIEHAFTGNITDPLFYTETRLSHGKKFKMIKFNIFQQKKINALKLHHKFIHTKQLEKNGGLTKTGWVLKQIYMDELPQFINVLIGDMSVVGPRPLNSEVSALDVSRGQYSKFQVPAGITGHHQSQKFPTGRGRELDEEYVSFYGSKPWYKLILFDLKIIMRTLRFITKAQGI